MNCRGCSRHLSAYFDGELSPRRDRAVRRHLEMCPACRTALDQLGTLTREMAGLSTSPPADLSGEILTALHAARDGHRPRTSWPLRPSPALAWASAAVLCLAAGLGVVALRELGPLQAPPPVSTTAGERETSITTDETGRPLPEKRRSQIMEMKIDKSEAGPVPQQTQPEGDPSRIEKQLLVPESVPVPPSEQEAREKKVADPSPRTEVFNAQPAPGLDAEDGQLRSIGYVKRPAASAPPCEGGNLFVPREDEIVGCLSPRGPGAVKVNAATVGPIRVEIPPGSPSSVPAYRQSKGGGEATPVSAEEKAETPILVDRLDQMLVPLSGPLPLPALSPMEPWSARLEVTVAADGTVIAASPVAEASDPRAAALARTVIRWRFEEPILEGRPVRVQTIIEVHLIPSTP